MSSQIEEFRHDANERSIEAIQEFEAVVVLTRRTHTAQETEKSFTECVSRKLQSGKKPFRITKQAQFVDLMFPYFEPRLAPNNPYEMPALLAKPGVLDRINDIGVRYVIWIDGSTETLDQGGTMTCAFGAAGGGCLGITWREKESSYEASIWDLKRQQVAGTISADAKGTSYMPALVIPIPMIARTAKVACNGLANQIHSFLTEGG
ncbi:MAG: hypothetical protein O6844_02575 [Gammaproteobacteria bacterium]|nr:hypothetical protein [Gammaproteobacteria bacterium]